jgi:hypothetical protein
MGCWLRSWGRREILSWSQGQAHGGHYCRIWKGRDASLNLIAALGSVWIFLGFFVSLHSFLFVWSDSLRLHVLPCSCYSPQLSVFSFDTLTLLFVGLYLLLLRSHSFAFLSSSLRRQQSTLLPRRSLPNVPSFCSVLFFCSWFDVSYTPSTYAPSTFPSWLSTVICIPGHGLYLYHGLDPVLAAV